MQADEQDKDMETLVRIQEDDEYEEKVYKEHQDQQDITIEYQSNQNEEQFEVQEEEKLMTQSLQVVPMLVEQQNNSLKASQSERLLQLDESVIQKVAQYERSNQSMLNMSQASIMSTKTEKLIDILEQTRHIIEEIDAIDFSFIDKLVKPKPKAIQQEKTLVKREMNKPPKRQRSSASQTKSAEGNFTKKENVSVNISYQQHQHQYQQQQTPQPFQQSYKHLIKHQQNSATKQQMQQQPQQDYNQRPAFSASLYYSPHSQQQQQLSFSSNHQPQQHYQYNQSQQQQPQQHYLQQSFIQQQQQPFHHNNQQQQFHRAPSEQSLTHHVSYAKILEEQNQLLAKQLKQNSYSYDQSTTNGNNNYTEDL